MVLPLLAIALRARSIDDRLSSQIAFRWSSESAQDFRDNLNAHNDDFQWTTHSNRSKDIENLSLGTIIDLVFLRLTLRPRSGTRAQMTTHWLERPFLDCLYIFQRCSTLQNNPIFWRGTIIAATIAILCAIWRNSLYGKDITMSSGQDWETLFCPKLSVRDIVWVKETLHSLNGPHSLILELLSRGSQQIIHISMRFSRSRF
jgi:hypothetical protein